MGQGQADSGRALKLKILRTLAKVSSKKLYYHVGLQEVLRVAMMVAKEHTAWVIRDNLSHILKVGTGSCNLTFSLKVHAIDLVWDFIFTKERFT